MGIIPFRPAPADPVAALLTDLQAVTSRHAGRLSPDTLRAAVHAHAMACLAASRRPEVVMDLSGRIAPTRSLLG